MITPNSGIASFQAPNRNKLTVPTIELHGELTVLEPRKRLGVAQESWLTLPATRHTS